MRHAKLDSSNTSTTRWPVALDLLAGLAAVVVLALTLHRSLATPANWVIAAAIAYLVLAALVFRYWTADRRRSGRRGDFGWANRVTLARVALVAVLAGVFAAPEIVQRHGAVMASLAFATIALDGVDGWLARAANDESRFGARFDMEIDALLILVLSIAVLLDGRAGAWVLAIGAMRYVFVLAGTFMPWMQGVLPPSFRRKAICVAQGIVLSAALLSWLPAPLVRSMLALTLAALVYSFGRDTLWLWCRRVPDHG